VRPVTPATYRILDTVADSFNPLFAILALVCPFIRKPRPLRPALLYYLSAATAIGFVYLVRAVDGRQQIWNSFGFDFSTHSAFAASLAVSMGAFRRSWIAPLALAIVLYFSLELIMRYHGLIDILSSATLAGLAALLLHLFIVRVSRRSAI
jgi:hypothetical protein